MFWTPGSRHGYGPFRLLVGPKKTPELKYFYPTDLLVTGYDILFFLGFQVMIMGGMEMMEDIPFKSVLSSWSCP